MISFAAFLRLLFPTPSRVLSTFSRTTHKWNQKIGKTELTKFT